MSIELTHTEEDRAVVEAQLGRPTRGKWAVARRCHLGVPMVIESYPRLDDGSPFPTLFWLTCPLLAKRASVLESGGRLARMSSDLQGNASLRDRLAGAIERYRARREAHDALGVDETSSPGGGPDRVKCLHAHLAHELSDPPNPIGALTLERAGWPDCAEPCFRVP